MGNKVERGVTAISFVTGITEQDVYDDIASNIPVGRIPTDEACAGAILYLLSPYASEVTGATLDVNGGMLMR